jgi:transcriptional regulator GlxA family with amidase domain
VSEPGESLTAIEGLRLYEAQRLMLTEDKSAETAAYEVGYESPTQFNREYKRQFGEPPHRDIKGTSKN